MAVSIDASLVGAYTPRTVQIVITGLTVGAEFTVTGSWAGGSWPVRAGTETATASQVVLSDLAAPINVPVTYTVVQGGSQAVSGAVTVAYGHEAVLQSLAGDMSVAVEALANGAPLEMVVRQAAHYIPGRSRPVIRYDVAGGESGQLSFDTEAANTSMLKAMLRSGAPMLLRTDGTVGDLDAVSFLSFTRVSSSQVIDTRRRWTLDYQLVDDPEPTSPTGLPTWEDLDTAYAGLTWADFDAEFSGRTWAQFDLVDWATRAAS